MIIGAFHPECVAIATNGLEKTCAGCIAEAQRCRADGETVAGYLLRVAELA